MNFRTLGVIALAFSLVFGLSFTTTQAEEVDTSSGGGIIKVTGEGEMSVDPDIGYIDFAVISQAEDVKTAYDDTVSKMNDVQDALKEYGIKKDDIETDSFNIREDRSHRPQEEEEREDRIYNVSTSITVTVEDLDDMGDIIDLGVNNGANNVSSLDYDVKDREKFKLKALEAAMEQAETKGERMAAFYDNSLGDPIEVIEDRVSFSRHSGLDFSTDVEVTEEAAMDMRETLPIEPGDIEITSSIAVKYNMN